MKIRTQNLLLIVPIFLLMIIIIDIFVYHSEKGEIEWGRREEAFTYALSLSEYMNVFLTGGKADGAEAIEHRMTEKFAPLFENSRIGSIFIEYPKNSGRLIYAQKRRGILPDSFQNELWREADKSENDVYISPIYTKDGRFYTLSLYSGNVHVGIVLDAAMYNGKLKKAVQRMAYLSLGGLIVSLLVSFFLSRLIAGKIHMLNNMARAINEGKYDVSARHGLIREINDLGDTFNTMRILLMDRVQRTKQNLIEMDRFRDEKDLISVIRSLAGPSIRRKLSSLLIRIDCFSDRSAGDFYGFIPDGKESKTCFLYLGKLAECSDLSAALTACSVGRFLELTISANETEALPGVIGDVFSMYPVSALHIARIDAENGTADVWSREGGDQRMDSVDIGQRNLCLDTLDKKNQETLALYQKRFPNSGPDTMLKELRTLMYNADTGSILVVGMDRR